MHKPETSFTCKHFKIENKIQKCNKKDNQPRPSARNGKDWLFSIRKLMRINYNTGQKRCTIGILGDIAVFVPDLCNKVSISVKQIVSFLLVSLSKKCTSVKHAVKQRTIK